MKNRNLIFLETDQYTIKESLLDSDGETVWEVRDPKNNNYFLVHTNSLGHMYITFFKKKYISNECSQLGIKEICKILLERGLNLTINIYYTNVSLIILLRKIGFKKFRNVKHLYYLETLE